MSENWREEPEQAEGAIQVYEGRPNDIAKPGEQGRFRRFVGWLFPHLKAKWDMAERLAEARVRQEEATAEKVNAEARKFAAEAAEITARMDSEQQDTIRKHFDLVDALGTDEETAQTLKLAKMIEANPEIAAQVEKVGDIIDRLRIVRGVTVGQIKGALPMPTDSGMSDSATGEGE